MQQFRGNITRMLSYRRFIMTRTIENNFLKISVSDHGAELTGIYDKTNDREILWQADPAYWKRHAPVLFPNVGRNYKDIWRLNGKEYPSSQHGFARDSDFICTDITDTSLSFVLKSSEETLNVYPFAFALKITYTLKKHDLEVCWEVVNNDSETMFFTIGGHPAFRVPVREGESQSDYRLAFEGLDTLTYLLIDTSVGTVLADEPHTLSLENGTCSIAPHMFDKDALVFDNGQIQKAGILFPDGTPYLTLTSEGFPNFGIWSVPGAPFVCLEPWMGRCDDCGFEKPLSEKANINVLKPDEEFIKSYQITVH